MCDYIKHFEYIHISITYPYIHILRTSLYNSTNPKLSCCLHETLSGPWLGNDALVGQVDRTSGVFWIISKGLRGSKL